MSDIVVHVENLSKRYRIGVREVAHESLGSLLLDTVRRPFRNLRQLRSLARFEENGRDAADIIWALKDVSFEVAHGEVLGIIGRNGAGKSTLLKILSRITEPTSGRARLRGRVASLLEVGTGFHPELTGRENTYLNGTILGMRRAEIDRKFDAIVAFAGVETFIDTPVKRYSSGMQVRLAFAVAAHLEPEILIIDEVLAVGDADFQRKCMGKMGDVAKGGRTVLFVSHNMMAVENLCNRTIWLDGGTIRETGPSSRVIGHYLQTSLTMQTEQVWDNIATAPGDETVRLRRAAVQPEHPIPGQPVTVQTPLCFEFEYWNLKPDTYLNLSLVLHNDQGVVAFNTIPITDTVWHGRPFPAGLFCSRCHIPGNLLNDGTYRAELYVVQDQSKVLFRCADILVFDVAEAAEMRTFWYGKWIGAVRPTLQWQTELLQTGAAPAVPASVDGQR